MPGSARGIVRRPARSANLPSFIANLVSYMRTRSSSSWHSAGLTDIGRVRTSNQDAFAVRDDLALWVIADGMGGPPGGDIASRLAVETIPRYMMPHLLEGGPRTRPGTCAPDLLLAEAIQAANDAIREAAAQQPELEGMGTTVVALHIPPGPEPKALIAHVGDSRAYVLRDGRLLPLTRDHSLVEEHIRRGLLTPANARWSPLSHVLTRAVGTDAQVMPDLVSHALLPDDVLLLCTDGITKMLEDGAIAELLTKTTPSLAAMCRVLVDEANRLGGLDNSTVVLIGSAPTS
jgi:protein phosphatase